MKILQCNIGMTFESSFERYVNKRKNVNKPSLPLIADREKYLEKCLTLTDSLLSQKKILSA